ncbi:hypothetical protein ACI79J_15375 [Geodermatophilus sp. SYSU D01062]
MTSTIQTTTSSPEPESSVEDISTLPLSALPLTVPGGQVPGKTIKALRDQESLPLDFALLLEAAQASNLFNYPLRIDRLRSAYGEVRVAAMHVNTSIPTPAPMNVRNKGKRRHEVRRRKRSGQQYHPDLPALEPSPTNEPCLIQRCESLQQVLDWKAYERSQSTDNALKEDIKRLGVQKPPLLVFTRLLLPDGSQPAALVAADGTRRVTNAQGGIADLVGTQYDLSLAAQFGPDGRPRPITAEAVKDLRKSLTYPGASASVPLFPASNKDTDVRAWIEEIEPTDSTSPSVLAQGDASDGANEALLQADRERVAAFQRCRTMPARVIVGFTPYRDRKGRLGTLRDAVMDLVRREHIEVARGQDWARGDSQTAIGTEILTRLSNTADPTTGVQLVNPFITSAIEASADTATDAHGNVLMRDALHATFILAATVGAPAVDSPTWRAVLDELAVWKQNPHPKTRALIAADLALPLLDVPQKDYGQIVAALAGLFIGREWRARPAKISNSGANATGVNGSASKSATLTWHDLKDRPLVELYDGAIAEHGNGVLGPYSLALGMAGGIALIVNPDEAQQVSKDGKLVAWRRLTQTGLGGKAGSTTANPEAIVRKMLTTPRGLELLYNAALQVSTRLAGTRTEPVTLNVTLVNGRPVPLTESVLRREFAPPGDTNSVSTSPTLGSHKDQYDVAVPQFLKDLTALADRAENLQTMREPGSQPLFQQYGIPADTVAAIRQKVEVINDFATEGRVHWRKNQHVALEPDLSVVADEAQDSLAGIDGGDTHNTMVGQE